MLHPLRLRPYHVCFSSQQKAMIESWMAILAIYLTFHYNTRHQEGSQWDLFRSQKPMLFHQKGLDTIETCLEILSGTFTLKRRQRLIMNGGSYQSDTKLVVCESWYITHEG